MPSTVVTTAAHRDHIIQMLKAKKPPYTVTIKDGKNRSLAQNRLQRMWLNEAAEQLKEDTAEGYRAYCKLHFGVPILRNDPDDNTFRLKYDEIFKPLQYEMKLQLMAEPFDFPVTRKMKMAQKSEYLDAMYQHFTGLGVLLTQPPSDWDI